MQSRAQLWGYFAAKLSGRSAWFRLIEQAMNWRSGLTGIATGDQALLVHSELFQRLNGFAALPLMEDVDFCRRARRLAAPHRLPFAVTTSSRRWEEKGILRTVLLMWSLRFQFWCGVSATKLAQKYR